MQDSAWAKKKTKRHMSTKRPLNSLINLFHKYQTISLSKNTWN